MIMSFFYVQLFLKLNLKYIKTAIVVCWSLYTGSMGLLIFPFHSSNYLFFTPSLLPISYSCLNSFHFSFLRHISHLPIFSFLFTNISLNSS